MPADGQPRIRRAWRRVVRSSANRGTAWYAASAPYANRSGRRACWTSASTSRVESVVRANTAPTDAMATTRSPGPMAVETACSVIRSGPRRRSSRRAGRGFAAPNTVLLTMTTERDDPQGASPGRAPRRDAPEHDAGRRGRPWRWRSAGPGSVVAARPTSQVTAIASLVSGLVRPRMLASRSSDTDTGRSCAHRARPTRGRRRRRCQPSRSVTIRSATSWTNRWSCVAAISRSPVGDHLAEDGQQAFVAVAILTERRLVEDQHPGAPDEGDGQRQSPLLTA